MSLITVAKYDYKQNKLLCDLTIFKERKQTNNFRIFTGGKLFAVYVTSEVHDSTLSDTFKISEIKQDV